MRLPIVQYIQMKLNIIVRPLKSVENDITCLDTIIDGFMNIFWNYE